MKQDLIDTFLVKIADKLTIEEKIELQKQLLTCDDKAFALLMSHNKPTIRSNSWRMFWRGLLCIISAGSIIISIVNFIICLSDVWDEDLLIIALVFAVFFLLTIYPIIIWYNGVKLKYTPKNKRLYEDYLKIIKSYQNTSLSVE